MQFASSYTVGSTELRHSSVEGNQPYSRINELVMNSFVDPQEWQNIGESVTKGMVDANTVDEYNNARNSGTGPMVEVRPLYDEWSTVLPGYILVSRKCRDKSFRGFTAAETAAPVVACAQGMVKALDADFFFSGVARSKSIKDPNAKGDDFFTMFVGGMCTILNNSTQSIHHGDGVAWTFGPDKGVRDTYAKRQKEGPRRIAIVRVPPGVVHPRKFGTCKSFAKPMECFDILLGPTST